MSDARLIPSNGRVADIALQGQVEAARFVKGAARLVSHPVADLLSAPGGKRERQLLAGEAASVYEDKDGWSFVQCDRDGYVGYLPSDALSVGDAPTHRVTALATHAYPAADFKTHDLMSLSFGARVTVTGREGKFASTTIGYIPTNHLDALDKLAKNPVEIARMFLGTPYLWGGNSRLGLDCSGLVQAACLACGVACPGDSDQQCDAFADASGPDQPGDLLFWDGHVGMIAAPGRLIHANSFHMAVTEEPLDGAIARIALDTGPVLARKRPAWRKGDSHE